MPLCAQIQVNDDTNEIKPGICSPVFLFRQRAASCHIQSKILFLKHQLTGKMTDKIQVIEEILDGLNAETNNMDEFNRKYATCIEQIAGLPDDYNELLRDYLRSLSDKMDEDNHVEACFQVALEGLVDKRQPEIAFELASEALLSDTAIDKDFYTKFLIRLNHPGTAETLIRSFPLFESDFDDELDGFGEEEAIEYLMDNKIAEAYPSILYFLPDSAPRVRATTLQFINRFDKQEATSKLLELLEVEDWEYNILLILKMLYRWKMTQSLPQIKAYYEAWNEEEEENEEENENEDGKQEAQGKEEDKVARLLELMIRDFSEQISN